MHIGIPTEIKNNEHRVAIIPAGVHTLVGDGHEVSVQAGAGLGSGHSDEDYRAAGATIGSRELAWSADLVLKVKEPMPEEFPFLRADLTLFTYLHLAANPALVDALVSAGTTALAYESVRAHDGGFPLLAPMSEIAGRLSVLVGAYHLMSNAGGMGVLLAGVPGVRPAHVVVLGAGQAGQNAVDQAVGHGARVTVLDLSIPRLRAIDERYGGRVSTVVSTAYEIERLAVEADLLIGAVLVPGAHAPRLVSHDLVTRMRPGSVLVDIAIDQGGCFEDSRPTTHADPVYRVADSLFYCVANMPGAVAETATAALTNATLPFVGRLAELGWRRAAAADAALAAAIATTQGAIVHPAVAATFPEHATLSLHELLD